jgi:hypothetical protein
MLPDETHPDPSLTGKDSLYVVYPNVLRDAFVGKGANYDLQLDCLRPIPGYAGKQVPLHGV